MVIAPWNYPYLTAVNTIIPALAAGNAVILKHASQTLLVGERFAEAAKRAGLPAGVFTNLVLGHADTETLIASGRIDHINFTGSVEGGRRIERAAAGTFATLGLELGGKDPAYVRADANLDHAVENLVDGSFFNSGQSCCGVERIYVHRDVYDRFVPAFVENARGWTLGDPLDPATIVGPMARPNFADLVREQTAEALRKGATAHLKSTHPRGGAGSTYLAPEVLTGVNHQMAVMREESFGPVVGIMHGRRRRRGDHADERQPLRAHRLDLDRGPRRRGAARGAGRDRHGLRQPLRLSRSGAGLDRRQGHRQGRRAERDRLRQSHAAEVVFICGRSSATTSWFEARQEGLAPHHEVY